LCKVTASTQSWPVISHHFTHTLPQKLKELQPDTVMDVLVGILRNLPLSIQTLIAPALEQTDNLEKIFNVVSSTKLYELVKEALQHPSLGSNPIESTSGASSSSSSNPQTGSALSPDLMTLLLMSAPSQLFKELSQDLRSQFKELRTFDHLPMELSKEVLQLRYQMLNLAKQCACHGDTKKV